MLITFSKLFKMNCIFLPTCLKGKYGARLRQFSNKSYVVFGAERVNKFTVKNRYKTSKCTDKYLYTGLI